MLITGSRLLLGGSVFDLLVYFRSVAYSTAYELFVVSADNRESYFLLLWTVLGCPLQILMDPQAFIIDT